MTEPCDHDFPRRGDFCLGCDQPLPGTLAKAALRVANGECLAGSWQTYCFFCGKEGGPQSQVKHYPACPWVELRDALVALGVKL